MKWQGLGNEDITEAFTRLGHKVFEHPFSDKELHKDEKIEKDIKDAAQRNNVDIIFSFNYFPIIAKVCHDNGIPYFSWIYDSPAVLVYHFSLVYPENHVFLFDYEEYSHFYNFKILYLN